MKKKTIIMAIIMVCFGFLTKAHSQAINIYIPKKYGFDNSSRNILENTLRRIATNQGFMVGDSRFIITAKIDVLSFEVENSAPPMMEYNLGVTFYIGDGVKGSSFTSYYVETHGLGRSKKVAFRDAIRKIKETNELADFMSEGKAEISDYYQKNCDIIIQEAQSNAEMGSSDKAMITLLNIPKSETSCWKKANKLAVKIYKKDLELDCEEKMNEAKGVWSAQKTIESAMEVSEILAKVSPESNCFQKVKEFYRKISASIDKEKEKLWEVKQEEIKNKWNLEMERAKNETEMSKKMLDMYRDVNVEKHKKQPVVYKSLF